METPDYQPTTMSVANATPLDEANLRYNYLIIRNTSYKSLPIFFTLYPTMIPIANDLEEKIYTVAKYLHSKYLQIFVNNDSNIPSSRLERYILNIIHKRYLTTKQRTTPSRINDILSQIHPIKLKKLLQIINHRLPKTID